MAQPDSRRMTVRMEGEFVVFLIGMRINRLWKVWKWWPVAAAMPRMLAELRRQPELGLLHARTHFGVRNVFVVQYWRSWDQLHDYATGKSFVHLPAWQAFNRTVATNGDVGIWHETYLVPEGHFECVYANMPPYGLGRVGERVEAVGPMRSASSRLGEEAVSDGETSDAPA